MNYFRYFRDSNTEGYSANDLAALNTRVASILEEMGECEDDPFHLDNVKNACDQAHNEFTTKT